MSTIFEEVDDIFIFFLTVPLHSNCSEEGTMAHSVDSGHPHHTFDESDDCKFQEESKTWISAHPP